MSANIAAGKNNEKKKDGFVQVKGKQPKNNESHGGEESQQPQKREWKPYRSPGFDQEIYEASLHRGRNIGADVVFAEIGFVAVNGDGTPITNLSRYQVVHDLGRCSHMHNNEFVCLVKVNEAEDGHQPNMCFKHIQEHKERKAELKAKKFAAQDQQQQQQPENGNDQDFNNDSENNKKPVTDSKEAVKERAERAAEAQAKRAAYEANRVAKEAKKKAEREAKKKADEEAAKAIKKAEEQALAERAKTLSPSNFPVLGDAPINVTVNTVNWAPPKNEEPVAVAAISEPWSEEKSEQPVLQMPPIVGKIEQPVKEEEEQQQPPQQGKVEQTLSTYTSTQMETAMARLLEINATLTNNNIQLNKQIQGLYNQLAQQAQELAQMRQMQMLAAQQQSSKQFASLPPGHVVMPNLFQQAAQGPNPLFMAPFGKQAVRN